VAPAVLPPVFLAEGENRRQGGTLRVGRYLCIS
jgi:hypothetical protein